MYTLLQKKRNFSETIFPGDPGSLTLTPGHVHFVTLKIYPILIGANYVIYMHS